MCFSKLEFRVPLLRPLAAVAAGWRRTVAAAMPAMTLTMTLTMTLVAPEAAFAAAPAASAAARPALTVTVTTPQRSDWPLTLAAAGSIAPWQEVVIASEIGGWRLVEVAVQIGDRVKRGQLLARLSTDMLQVDMAQTRAAISEAEALLAEARANADRARELQPTGVMSRQQTTQVLTGETTARARLDALRARLQADELRLAQARILAPDDGIISARMATVGAVAQPGQELFRLIRQGRLEWRAELTSADLGRVQPGMAATITTAGGQTAQGRVRMVAPTIDPATRTGLVYVDLSAGSDARAGMFARGDLQVGRSAGLTLPQSAVLLRDGFHVVLLVAGDQRVAMTKVSVGRRVGERIEITAGLAADAAVVNSGGAFLADGDLVRVVDGKPVAAAAPAAPAAPPRSGGAAR